MILKLLEKSQKEKSIIGIWVYGDDEGFWSGYVKSFTEEIVVLQHFTKYGKPDGLIIEKIENIESIDFEDDYVRAMEYLVQNSSKLGQDITTNITISSPKTWQKDILKQQLGKVDQVVKIQVNSDSVYTGLVEDCDEENVVLRILGQEGEDKGKALFRIQDISSIRNNDMDSRKRLLLYNWRKK
ncbi:MAG: hypothetical protein AAGG68_08275 [Bacteroidota bacterium]